MAVSLLKYANRAKVAEALTAQGYEVTRMTVNRWAAGGEMPRIAAKMIAELFGHQTEEAPPPKWATGLAEDIASAALAAVTTGNPTLSDEALEELRRRYAAFQEAFRRLPSS